MLWKEIRKSIGKSKGRFFSIMMLIALGSFALVGLMVTGPDMQKTGAHYFSEQNMMDLAIISDYGLDEDDQKIIEQEKGIQNIEFGYLKDVTIKKSETSIRIFSNTKNVSQYIVTKGRLPKTTNEIALDNHFKGQYKLNENISFDEPEDMNGDKSLIQTTFKVVGFVNSSEILADVNMGSSTTGTGELNGFAVVEPEVFDSEVFMIARMTFSDTESLDPYSKNYSTAIKAHKDSLNALLGEQPQKRLVTLKKEAQKKIDEGQEEIDKVKDQLADAKEQLVSAKEQLVDGENTFTENEQSFNSQVKTVTEQISDGASQISAAKSQLENSENQLNEALQQLISGEATLSDTWKQLQTAKTQLDNGKAQLDMALQQLQSGANAINQGEQQLVKGYEELNEKQELLTQGQQQLNEAEQQLAEKQAEWTQGITSYNQKKEELNGAVQQYNEAKEELDQAQTNLDRQKAELEEGKTEYEASLAELQNSVTNLSTQLESVKESLKNPDLSDEEQEALEIELKELQEKISQGQLKLSEIKEQYNQFIAETYTPGKEQISKLQETINTKNQILAETQEKIQSSTKELEATKTQLDQGKQAIDQVSQELANKRQEILNGQKALTTAEEELEEAKSVLQKKTEEYQAGLNEYNNSLSSFNQNQSLYYEGIATWIQGMESLKHGSEEYQKNVARLESAKDQLADKERELTQAKDELATKTAEGEKKLADAKKLLSEKQKEYDEKNKEYQTQLPNAQKEIADSETELAKDQEKVDHLSLPIYSINSRREMAGSDGYKVYDSIAKIVKSLANIFPVFLYFVAALVTLTTMTRFVDEERINAGTLKALGYTNRDVIKKFVVYGLASSVIGAIIGIVAGHMLLPYIVYHAYQEMVIPQIEFHFYPLITLMALVLAIVVTVIPAVIVAKRELTQRPSRLLLPKPPTAGSKILLERITPLWKRMTFTQKVTARNIFRYKRRMFMTIFGVAGSVALLFTGLAVQNSISGVSERQFGTLIDYDLIVAKNDYVSDENQQEIDKALNSDTIKSDSSVHFETVTRVAGVNKDEQEISMIVPEKSDDLANYIQLINRKTQDKLSIHGEGAIISERLATLLKLKVGDKLTFKDENKKTHSVKISGITEMYIGHFIFMSKETYQKTMDHDFVSNGYLVTLKNQSKKETKKNAAKLMKLEGVKGVVQNTTQMTQIDTVVDSLNQIMLVLILVAAALALVILYNLTNINVSERIRELSTIKVLGFYNNEVTMYIYRETIILSILGIIVGYGFGAFLHAYILNAVPPDNTMFNPGMWLSNFTIPAAITVIITGLLGIVVYQRLKNVDMLEALKSVE